MARYRFDALLLVLIVATLALAWSVHRDVTQPNYEPMVEGQMARSPAYDSFALNPNFADGLTLRLPPPGTIARGHVPFRYKATPEDALLAGLKLHNPYTRQDEHRLARGGVVFANFCKVCHGPFGQGDGSITVGGFPTPPSLVTERAIRMPDGQMFHVLTTGQGRMPSVAPQLSAEDRWCAILYVRQLQQDHRPYGSSGAITLASTALLFKQNCAGCHGEDGSGSAIRKALPNIPDFTSLAWQVSQTELALVNQIDYGSLPLMPSFRYKLTREEIQGLAVYVRSFPSRKPATAVAAPVTANLSAVEVYQTYCFACHETTGKGNVFMRKAMPEIPDFTLESWQKSRTDKDLSHSILQGKGKFMLPMKDKLGPVDVKDMVALVRDFKGGKKEIPLAPPKPAGPPPPVGIAQIPHDIEPTLPPRLGPSTDDIRKPLPAPSGELAAQIRVGAGLFKQFCLVCHGPDGTGSLVRAAMPPIPDFTNRAWHRSRKDAELVASILGGKGTLMPSNSDRITRPQALNLLAYIRSFAGIRVDLRPAVTDAQFEKSVKQLQKQYEELERQLKQMRGAPGR
jgi:mono/diheme cytochrome c family protein